MESSLNSSTLPHTTRLYKSAWCRRYWEDKTKRLFSLLAFYKANCCFLVFCPSATDFPPSKYSSCLELLVCTTLWFVLFPTPFWIKDIHPSHDCYVPSACPDQSWVKDGGLEDTSDYCCRRWFRAESPSSPSSLSSSSTTPINIPPRTPRWAGLILEWSHTT